MRAGDVTSKELCAPSIMRDPATFAETHTATEAAQEKIRMAYLTPRNSVNLGLDSPFEARQVNSGEEPRTLPQPRNANAARLPSIAQVCTGSIGRPLSDFILINVKLLNETTPPTAPSAPKSQGQYGVKDSPSIYGYDTEARCVPRRLPDPTAIEPTLASPPPERRTRDETPTVFHGRPWQPDHYVSSFTQEQQRNQEQAKGSLTYPRAQDARRQTWAPAQVPASLGLPRSPPQSGFAPVVHRSSVPSIEQLGISSTVDGYPPAAGSYSHSAASYDAVRPEPRLRQDQYVTGSYQPASAAPHHSRSDDYMRYPYPSAYPSLQPYANQGNGNMIGYAPLNPAAHGRLLPRPSNDVPRKRPKLPAAFKLETRRWIDAHIWHPYPSKDFQQDLAARHGLEQSRLAATLSLSRLPQLTCPVPPEQVDFHFVNERRRYVVAQLERERAIGNHAPPDLEARNQASPTVNGSRNPDDRYHPRRYSGRFGRRGSRFSHGSTGSTSTNVSGDSDGPGFSTSV